MADQFQVTCHKPDGADADQRIDGLGGPAGGGWYWDIDTIIRNIESDNWRLWTSANGKSVWVVVARRNNGRKYLKTEADGYEPNNLLALKVCP